MLMIDGDYPMAHGGVLMDRDLTLPIDQVRSQPEMPGGTRRPDTARHYGLDTGDAAVGDGRGPGPRSTAASCATATTTER